MTIKAIIEEIKIIILIVIMLELPSLLIMSQIENWADPIKAIIFILVIVDCTKLHALIKRTKE